MLLALEVSVVAELELMEHLPDRKEPGAMRQCQYLLSQTKEQQENKASKQTKKGNKIHKCNRKKAKKGGGLQLNVFRNRSCKLAQD